MKNSNLIETAFLLKKTTLFAALDLDLLLTIADKTEFISYKQGAKIFQIDQNGGHMYLIIEGLVSIQDKHGKSLAELHYGDFFGDEALFNHRPRGYEASCLSGVTVGALSRFHLVGIIEECPSVALSLLEAYSFSTDFRRR